MEILKIIPKRSIYDKSDDPPYEINGRVIPIMGNNPIVIEIL